MLSIAGLLAFVACGGDTSSPPLVANPTDVAFGDVYLGGSTSRTITLTNASTKAMTITDVSSTGSALVTSGNALPLTLTPGETTSLAVELIPTATGDVTGTVTITSDDPVSPTIVKHLGKGIHPSSLMTAAPSAIAFGEVAVGDRAVQNVTLTNGSTRDVSITNVVASGSGVSASVPALPFTLRVGESASVAVMFAPTAAGEVTGQIAVRSNQPHPETIIEISGSGAVSAPPVSVTASPTTLAFGDVTVGSFNARTVTLTNLSAEPIAISALDTTGAGFTASGLSLPATLSPGSSATLTVTFTPTESGASSGTLSARGASGADALAVVSYSANGVPSASITSVTVRDAAVVANGSVQMAADVTATGTIDKSITWSVDGGAPGSIDATTGVYTAPSTPGAYRVWATSKADPSKQGYGTVTVSSPPQSVSISLNPTTASLAAGATQVFTSTVTGSTNTAVTWSVQEGAMGGSITAAGLYTAPATAGTYHVVATSSADPTKRGTSTVTVNAVPVPPPTSTPDGFVDVKSYGAKGDGVTDDTAAFRAAAATGKNLFIPGTSAHYKLTARVDVHGSVKGDGSMPEIRMYGANGGTGAVVNAHTMFLLANYNGPGAVFSGLHLNGQWDGGSAGEWDHGIQILASKNVTIENNVIENAYGDSVLISQLNYVGCENVTVRKNTLKNPRRCDVAVTNARGVVIDGNTITKPNTFVAAIDIEPDPNPYDVVRGVQITNNVFDAAGTAVLLYNWPGNQTSGDVTVTGNSGRAYSFFQRAGAWENVTVSNNAF